MLKPLSLSLMVLSLACAGVALAHGHEGSKWQKHHSNDSYQVHNWCTKSVVCDHWENDWHFKPKNDEVNDGGQHTMAAPELDPADAMGALTLLAGGLLVMRARRSTRKAS